MDEFLKMDVFFTVTTLAVVLVSGGIAYAIYRFLQLVEVLKRIAEAAETEVQNVQTDLGTLRASMKKEGLRLRHIVKFLGGSKHD